MPYRVLVTDEIDPEGVALLIAEPALSVDEVPTLPKDELLARIGDYDAIVGRSATRVSTELLRAATRLKVIGRAGVGIDNIAIDTATELGVAVINAPAGNTVAVAELFFGVVIGLLRHLPRAYESMRAGRWDRSELLGAELKGRTLGIIGLGRIGGEIAVRARAFGMEVVGYDPYVAESRFNALRVRRAAQLDELLDEADVLTVHTPLTEQTRGMVGGRELARLSPAAVVVNMARGGIVDESALADALTTGRIAGAAVDAFVKEPLASDHSLRGAPNLFLTPHIGASTAEAQRNVAVDACAAVRDALLRGELSRSINVAEGEPGRWAELRPARTLVRHAAAIAQAMLVSQGSGVVGRIDVRGGPSIAGVRDALLASAALGVLEAVVEHDRLNVINARSIAEGRGIELSFTETADMERASGVHALEVRLTGGVRDITVGGVAQGTHEGAHQGDGAVRITRIGAFRVDVCPRDTLLILTNNDVPGVIGRVGTILGEAGVNIAEYHQARLAQGGEALAAVSVDGNMNVALKQQLLALSDVRTATVVTFQDG
ncbi:MAG: phosphoglycerate dehydrogenase [Gemmatimonadaceae bacterium]